MVEMMKLFSLIIPAIFLFSFLFAAAKKTRVYDAFCEGVKGAIPLIVSLFPYIAAVLMLSEVFRQSGLEEKTVRFLAPFFECLGVPKELAELVLIKPLSGAGSTAVLSEIVETHGVDSYIARCACVVYGSSDTVFYIGAVYFAGCKRKKPPVALAIALFAYFLSVVLSCFLCRFL